LAIAKFRIKLENVQKTNNRIPKYNIENLKEEGENQKYIIILTKNPRASQTDKLETSDRWTIIRNTITEVARKSLGESRNQAMKWYNIECQNAMLKINEYRQNYLRNLSAELFETERKRCKQVI